CAVKTVRMSAHARKADIHGLIRDIRPKTLVLIHGETESVEQIAAETMEYFDGDIRIILPREGTAYQV
ncbi:MAG: MBL fold metallo-hydrolase RNA specificity domain-containing protein, partial [Ignavibacteria bacterium]